MTGARSPWPLVGARYLTGLLAAAQLGKLSALALIAAELGLSLPTVALAVSLLQVAGATLGAAAGLLAQRKRSANPIFPADPEPANLMSIATTRGRSGHGSAATGAVFGAGGGLSGVGLEGYGMGRSQRG